MKQFGQFAILAAVLFCAGVLLAAPNSPSNEFFKIEITESQSSVSVRMGDMIDLNDTRLLQDADIVGSPSRDRGVVGKPGEFALPSWTRWIEVPPGFSPVLEVNAGQAKLVSDIDLATFPSQLDNFQSLESPDTPSPIVKQDVFLPNEMATLSSSVRIGDVTWVMLSVSPYRYNYATRELQVYDDLSADVRFEISAVNEDRRKGLNLPVYQDLNRTLRSGSPKRDDFVQRIDNLGHYVIVTPDNEDILEVIEPLVEWKKRKGYLVTVLNIGDLNNDNAADLQAYLLDAWEDWDVPPTFVLLVGDGNGDADYRLPYFYDGAGQGQSWHVSDNFFVCFEGQENEVEGWVPEAFIGRLPVANIAEVERMITKIIGYEMEPYTEESWTSGALLIAAGVHSCIQTNEAVRDLMLEAGFDIDDIVEEFSEYHNNEQPNLRTIQDAVDEGVGFVNFRGYNNWANYPRNDPSSRENGWMLPIVTGMVCGTNDFTDMYEAPLTVGEGWIRGWRNDNPAGAVAVFGPTDLYTHTWFNNVMDGEFYHSLLNKDVRTLGALCVASKLALVKSYPSLLNLTNGLAVGYYFHTYTLLGDPSLQVWVHDPRELQVDFDAELPAGTNLIEVNVFDENDESIEGAYVHILSEDDIRYGGYSDSDGNLSLIVDPLTAGEYQLTITGPDIVPVLETIQVNTSTVYISLSGMVIDDDSEGHSEGNGDGVVNSGEVIDLIAVLSNTGNDQSEGFTARLQSESPWIEIEQDEIEFEGIDPDDEAQSGSFEVTVNSATPHGTTIDLDVIVEYGESEWKSVHQITVSSLEFQVYEFDFVNDLDPGTERELIIEIINVGSLDSDDLLGNLECSNEKVQIRRPEARYEAIEVDDIISNESNPFLVFAGPDAYQGGQIEFILTLREESGRVGTTTFTTTLGPIGINTPQGPDNYGYFAFDAADTATGLSVEYDWIEADQRVNGLQDNDDAGQYTGIGGSSVVIDLPFEFVYYGQPFNEATIGSNGWLAFGEHEQIAWHNLEMGNPLAPGAMVCPMWRDLYSGNVYTKYDEEEARFTVEWRGYRNTSGESTFEIILYDQSVFPSATGDGDIVFQYNNIPEPRDFAQEELTIGLCSPDRSSILQVTYAREWDERTSRISDETAIRFSTGEFNEFGSVSGRVVQLDNQDPVEYARVMIDGTGFFDNTDVNGNYLIERVPIGDYSITVFRRHYNNAVAADIQITENEPASVDFELTYPLFEADIEDIIFGVIPGDEGEVPFTISNDGIGPLEYVINLNFDAFNDERDREWDELFSFNASQATEEFDDQGLQGVTFIEDELYVSGQLESRRFPHKLYVFNRAGEMVRNLDQYTVDSSASRGYSEMAYNGENLLVLENNDVLEITLDGEIVDTILTGLRRPRAITYNPDSETMYIREITGSEFHEFDMDGNIIETYHSSGEDIWTYGMAWHPEDPDGYNLYIFAASRDANPPSNLQLHKLNTETGDILFVREFMLEQGDDPVSIEITKYWDPLLWSLIMLVSGPDGDIIHVFELGPNMTWIDPEPESGTILAGDDVAITVSFDSRDMPERTYDIMMEVVHNAAGDRYDIPVHFTVDENWTAPVEVSQPVKFAIESIWPNPFNPATRIAFSLPFSEEVTLTILDVAGRKIDEVNLGRLSAGRHAVNWSGSSHPSGLYLVRLNAGVNTVTSKMLLIK